MSNLSDTVRDRARRRGRVALAVVLGALTLSACAEQPNVALQRHRYADRYFVDMARPGGSPRGDEVRAMDARTCGGSQAKAMRDGLAIHDDERALDMAEAAFAECMANHGWRTFYNKTEATAFANTI